jgi:hypothetical protein
MTFDDIPEPTKSRLKKIYPNLGAETIDIIENSLKACPDWESAQDSIYNCLELLINDANEIQKLIL